MAFGLWTDGEYTNVGRLDKDGHQVWSSELAASSGTSLVADNSAVYCAANVDRSWKLTALKSEDGRELWSHPLPGLTGKISPQLRLSQDALVAWSDSSLLVLATSDGHVRATIDIKNADRDPLVASGYVVVQVSGVLTSISLESGKRSDARTVAGGCVTKKRQYLQFDSGKLIARALDDLSVVSRIAEVTQVADMTVRECGFYGSNLLVSGSAEWAEHVHGYVALLVDPNGGINHVFEYEGNRALGGHAFHWHGQSDLNGELTRFVPLPVRTSDGTRVQVLDLEAKSSALNAELIGPDVLFFRAGEAWIVGSDTGSLIVNGKNGTTVPQSFSVVEPSDTFGPSLWLFTGKPTTTTFEIVRLNTETLEKTALLQ